ncbi:MAG: hypothetical protein WAT70_04320, partial [Rhizobiaceae bacterium]
QGAAPADPDEGPELAALFPAEPNVPACYGRAYDARHLAQHPAQQVTGIAMRFVQRESGADPDIPGVGHLFQLQVKRRGDARFLKALGPCMAEDGRVFCGVECDGGGLYAKKRDDGALILSFDESWGIRMTTTCDEDEADAAELLPGADDKVFRLDPLPASQCPPYEQW